MRKTIGVGAELAALEIQQSETHIVNCYRNAGTRTCRWRAEDRSQIVRRSIRGQDGQAGADQRTRRESTAADAFP